MIKKYIQVPKYITQFGRVGSIRFVEQYINENIDDFRDGEIIGIEYYDENNEPVTANAIVKIEGRNATVYASVTEKDTIRVIESEEEPKDKSVIWLSDDGESGETSEGLRQMIRKLEEEIRGLKSIIERHDYALSSTIAGGDIITNSEKYDLEIENIPEEPDDANYTPKYAEDDFFATDFDMYLGNTKFYDYYTNTNLYMGQKYHLTPKFFNEGGEEIKEDDVEGFSYLSITILNPNIAEFDDEKSILLAHKNETSGFTEMVAEAYFDDGRVIRHDYSLIFLKNEDPYYVRYGEPNVHHMLVKEAETEEILIENVSYLCKNEFVWCPGNNTLYLKAKASNGTIQLFKINGTGDTPVPPEPGETVTFTVRDRVLYAVGEPLTVVDGTFNIPVATVENNTLYLIDK